jgi:hypothetical protein
MGILPEDGDMGPVSRTLLLMKIGQWIISKKIKWPGREADHSPPASAEVKKMWIYTSTPPYAFMA